MRYQDLVNTYKKQGFFAQKIVLTKAIAQELLSRNTHNRKVNETYIRSLIGDIDAGRWKFNGESIIIAEDGTVNDGQHRIIAVSRANRPIEVMLVYGVSASSQDTVDIGRARSAGDMIQLRGGPNYNTVAAAAGNLIRWEAGTFKSGAGGAKGRVYHDSKTAIVEYYFSHKDEFDLAHEAMMQHNYNVIGGRSFWLFLAILFARVDAAAMIGFMDQVGTGANLPDESPVLKLRSRLLVGRFQMPVKTELAIRAWNLWRKGQACRRGLVHTGNIPQPE